MSVNLCSSIDCGRAPVEVVPPKPLPGIDLMAKDYDSLLRAMLDLLPARAPGWADRTEADLGMAVLELFAYAGDQLSYLQDRVALEGYLRTATQYESVKKLLRLIDYTLYPGHAARTDLAIDAVGNAPLYLPAGFAVSTRGTATSAAVIFETGADAVIQPALSTIALAVDAPSNAAGDEAILASIATAPLLPGTRVLLETGAVREFATVASRAIGGTTTTVTFEAPLRNRYPHAGTAPTRVCGNIVAATHGATIRASATGNGRPAQNVALEFAPLTYTLDADDQPVSTLSVSVDGVPFHEVEEFVSSSAADNHYRLTRDNEGYVTVRFGDGSLGRVPPAAATIDVVYRVGTGEAGRAAADTLTEFQELVFPDASQKLLRIRNPFAAEGAGEPQSPQSARLLGPAQIAHQRRAVTEADFEYFVMQGVEVGGHRAVPVQAKARFQYTGSWLTTIVSIDLPDRAPLRATPALRAAFEAKLAGYRLIGTDVHIEDARYVPVSIGLRVEVMPEYFAREVRRAVEQVLVGVDAASKAAAFFAPGRFRFAQKLHLSDLYAAVTSVQGVRSVAVTRFKRLGDRYPDSEPQGFVDVGSLEVIRCDNDPAQTGNGVLFVRTCGGKDG
jgi:hypothetical protein